MRSRRRTTTIKMMMMTMMIGVLKRKLMGMKVMEMQFLLCVDVCS